MKLSAFIRPVTVDEALSTWSPGAAWLRGGTNLVDLLYTVRLQPDAVIDITCLPGPNGVETLPDGSPRISVPVRNSTMTHDRAFDVTYPMVAKLLLSGPSRKLRNSTTVARNLMQKTRRPVSPGARIALQPAEVGRRLQCENRPRQQRQPLLQRYLHHHQHFEL